MAAPRQPAARGAAPEAPLITGALVGTARPRLLASVRRQATPATIGALIRGSGVWELMQARGIRSTGHNVVVYRDEPDRHLMRAPGGIPVDIGAEIEAPFAGDAELSCISTPAGRFISVVHLGPIETLGEAYDAIFAHVAVAGLALAGPYWEYYGHWNDDPDKYDVSVNYLLAG